MCDPCNYESAERMYFAEEISRFYITIKGEIKNISEKGWKNNTLTIHLAAIHAESFGQIKGGA